VKPDKKKPDDWGPEIGSAKKSSVLSISPPAGVERQPRVASGAHFSQFIGSLYPKSGDGRGEGTISISSERRGAFKEEASALIASRNKEDTLG